MHCKCKIKSTNGLRHTSSAGLIENSTAPQALNLAFIYFVSQEFVNKNVTDTAIRGADGRNVRSETSGLVVVVSVLDDLRLLR